MAIRARLAAPPAQAPETWPYHVAKHTSLPAHLLWRGDRRMEAETYLSSGYGLRLAIEERAVGWQRLGQMEKVWQPSRLKGIQVGPDCGTPFLAATQVFDSRPVPRKWLALGRTENCESRFVKPGTILVTCSGAVGRATLAQEVLSGILVSHDLLRVEALESTQWGWIYAYLRSPQARAMMSGAHYGHIIKHLETSHLEALPVPVVRPEIAAEFKKRTQCILDLRNRAQELANEAESIFEDALGPLEVKDWGECGFSVSSATLFKARRRLEAVPHNPGITEIRRHLSKNGKGMTSVAEAGFDVWLPGRFKRIPAEDGVALLDSSAIFETNPDEGRRIADGNFGDPYNGRVKTGWLLLARSGQIYGVNGSVTLAACSLDGAIVSDHVIRIAPRNDAQIRSGYLCVALSHPTLGRPLVKSLAYGSSIPEIDPFDFANLEIVRIQIEKENAIADLAEESAELRARADVLERELAEEAGKFIEKFLAGDMVHFVTTMPALHETGLANPAALPEHSRVRLLRARTKAGLPRGAEGTIVHVYEEGGYEVEFIAGLKRPVVLTLEADEIEAVKAVP